MCKPYKIKNGKIIVKTHMREFTLDKIGKIDFSKDNGKNKKELLSVKVQNDKTISLHLRFKEKIKQIINDIHNNPNKKLSNTKVITFGIYKDLKIKLKEIIENIKQEKNIVKNQKY